MMEEQKDRVPSSEELHISDGYADSNNTASFDCREFASSAYGDDDMSYSSSSTSRVSELSSELPSIVDDSSSSGYDHDDILDELGNAYLGFLPLESIQVPSSGLTCISLSPSAARTTSENDDDYYWDEMLNWMRSRRSELDDEEGVMLPFKKGMLEKLLVSLPARRTNHEHETPEETEDRVIEWERVAPSKLPCKSSPKEEASKDKDVLMIPSWLQLQFPFQRLLETKSATLERIRTVSRTFFDSFTSAVIDRLFSWTFGSLEEPEQEIIHESSSSSSSNPPIERAAAPDAPKERHMVRGKEAFDSCSAPDDEGFGHPDECRKTCKSHKLNDETSSVASLETLETHISKLSSDDNLLESSWTWRVAEI